VSFGGADGLEKWTERLSALFKQYAAATEVQAELAK
jgi:hypothetical protein